MYKDAEIYVDGRSIGLVRDFSGSVIVSVPSGDHVLEFRFNGLNNPVHIPIVQGRTTMILYSFNAFEAKWGFFNDAVFFRNFNQRFSNYLKIYYLIRGLPKSLKRSYLLPMITLTVGSSITKRENMPKLHQISTGLWRLIPGMLWPMPIGELPMAWPANIDKAIADYNKSIEINPRYVEPYLNKAIVCEKLGHMQEALEAYKGFIQYASPQYAMYIEYVKQRISQLEGRIKNKDY